MQPSREWRLGKCQSHPNFNHLMKSIGDKAEQREWVEEKAQTWADGVLELSKVAGRYPQAAYAGLQKSLQQEWQFLQRVTNGLSDEFEAVEEALATKFLPSLFGNGESCDTKRQLV
jgi:hypothetical protein